MTQAKFFRQWRLLRVFAQRKGNGYTLAEMLHELAPDEPSGRTLRRDLDDLASVGFPVRDRNRPDGETEWFFDDQQWFGDNLQEAGIQLPPETAVALSLARDFLEPLLATPLGAGLGVLYRELEQSPAMEHFRELGPIFVQEGAGGKSYEGRAAKLRTIQEAIENHRRVKLNYRKPSSEESQWAIYEPLAVYVRHQSTYIVVRAGGDGPTIFLKLDRIYGARRTEERFSPQAFDVREHLSDCIGIFHASEVHTAKIRLSHLAGLVAEEEPLQEGQVVSWSGDQAILEVQYRGDIELVRWILGWGGQVEGLAPEKLRSRVAEELKKAAKKYDV